MSVTVKGRVPKEWSDHTVSHITDRLQTLERALASGADRYSAPSVPSFGPGTLPGGPGAGIPSTPPPAGPTPPPVTEEVQIISSDMSPHIHLTHELPYLMEEIRRLAETKPHTHNLDDVHGAVDDAQRIIAGQMFGG